MSVMILSARHLAAAALWCAAVGPDRSSLTVARMLARANSAAYAKRYRLEGLKVQPVSPAALREAAAWWAPILHCKATPEDVTEAMKRYPGAAAAYALSLLGCLSYQCAEFAEGCEPAEVRHLEAYRAKAAAAAGPTAIAAHVWAI